MFELPVSTNPDEEFTAESALLRSQLFDVAHQNNLYLIETALQDLGVLPQPKRTRPDFFDERLKQLIDAVPLE